LYQGTASAVPKSIIFPHLLLRPFGTTEVVP